MAVRRNVSFDKGRTIKLFVLCTVLAVSAGSALAGDPITANEVEIAGDVFEQEDISGVVAVGKHLIFATDELASVQVLKEEEQGAKYETGEVVSLEDDEIQRLANGDEAELDLEGAAADGNTIYVIGSHSRKRFKVEPGNADEKTSAENRERLETTSIERNRNWLFRFKLDDNGSIDVNSIQRISLRDFIDQHAVLGGFSGVPSKENGIDIEGLALKGKHLYAGFRGPVLRQNWVPVLRFKYKKSSAAQVRYVNLGGLGIRGMDTVDDGFLLLAGPVGDTAGPYRVYFWDGEDGIPGTGEPGSELHCQATITPTVATGKAEGITVIAECDSSWSVLVAFDGVEEKDDILGKYIIPKTPAENACN